MLPVKAEKNASRTRTFNSQRPTPSVSRHRATTPRRVRSSDVVPTRRMTTFLGSPSRSFQPIRRLAHQRPDSRFFPARSTSRDAMSSSLVQASGRQPDLALVVWHPSNLRGPRGQSADSIHRPRTTSPTNKTSNETPGARSLGSPTSSTNFNMGQFASRRLSWRERASSCRDHISSGRW